MTSRIDNCGGTFERDSTTLMLSNAEQGATMPGILSKMISTATNDDEDDPNQSL